MRIEKGALKSSIITVVISCLFTLVSSMFISDASVRAFGHQEISTLFGVLLTVSIMSILPVSAMISVFQVRDTVSMSVSSRSDYLACWAGSVLMIASSAIGVFSSSPFMRSALASFIAISIILYFVNLQSLISEVVSSLEE